MLGPKPPFRVCPKCGATSSEPWTNQLLVAMQNVGAYQGPVQGGTAVCEECDTRVECQVCQDTRWESVIEGGEWKRRRCECLDKRIRRVVKGLPLEFEHANLGNYQVRPGNDVAIDAAREWMKGRRDLYLCGPVGTGKTRLAASLGNESLERGTVAFVRVPDLLDRMRQIIGGNAPPEHEQEYLSSYKAVDLLVLDEVGGDKGSDYGRRILVMLYEARLDVGKRTIWTSNLDLDQLGEYFEDERLSSRIAGNADIVAIDGVDHRVESALAR